MIAPSGPVYQAGTLSGNPVAVAAGLAMLDLIAATPELYTRLEARTQRLVTGIETHLQRLGFQACVQHIGSMWTLFFHAGPVRSWVDAAHSDTKLFARFHQALLRRGVLLPPSQFEACFMSAAHDDNVIDETVRAIGAALEEIRA